MYNLRSGTRAPRACLRIPHPKGDELRAPHSSSGGFSFASSFSLHQFCARPGALVNIGSCENLYCGGRFRAISGGSASEREGGSASGEAASREGTRGRSRALETARRVTGASSPEASSGGFASARVGSRRARRKAEGCRAARFSRSARGRASRVRTVLCILSLAQYPCVLVGWFQFFFLRTTDATKQAREGQRRRRTARRASRDRGRRKEASEAERLPTARSRAVTDFAARTLPRTSPWSPPCAPRSPPAASRDPPSYWRGTE